LQWQFLPSAKSGKGCSRSGTGIPVLKSLHRGSMRTKHSYPVWLGSKRRRCCWSC
jgi:hypothetical protein